LDIIKRDAKSSLFIEINTSTTPHRFPSSLSHLIIEIKTRYWLTSILVNVKMILGSDNESQPSSVLSIGSSKKLNDHYAPRV
jgi:hypothetical protein